MWAPEDIIYDFNEPSRIQEEAANQIKTAVRKKAPCPTVTGEQALDIMLHGHLREQPVKILRMESILLAESLQRDQVSDGGKLLFPEMAMEPAQGGMTLV